MNHGKNPFKLLGDELARIRKRAQESLSEVSGAVEIADDRLTAYERGEARPSEDILQLLITHFNLHDEESDALWDLAGYNDKLPMSIGNTDEISPQQPAIMLLPLDARIVYSDTYQVTINQYGVVMNFMQNAGPNGQPLAVSRIGMSLEHAKRVAETLQQTIKTAAEFPQTKNLPAPKPDEDKKS
jgi:transcriptional regulator with XRE-family HTH domain